MQTAINKSPIAIIASKCCCFTIPYCRIPIRSTTIRHITCEIYDYCRVFCIWHCCKMIGVVIPSISAICKVNTPPICLIISCTICKNLSDISIVLNRTITSELNPSPATVTPPGSIHIIVNVYILTDNIKTRNNNYSYTTIYRTFTTLSRIVKLQWTYYYTNSCVFFNTFKTPCCRTSTTLRRKIFITDTITTLAITITLVCPKTIMPCWIVIISIPFVIIVHTMKTKNNTLLKIRSNMRCYWTTAITVTGTCCISTNRGGKIYICYTYNSTKNIFTTTNSKSIIRTLRTSCEFPKNMTCVSIRNYTSDALPPARRCYGFNAICCNKSY